MKHLLACALVAALALVPACTGLDPCTTEVALCYADGGQWVEVAGEPCGGHCEYPDPCQDPPGEVCSGGDPAEWCGCWTCSDRTNLEWQYTGDCEEEPTCEPPLVWNETAGKCAVDAYTPDGERRCAPRADPPIVELCWSRKSPADPWQWIPEKEFPVTETCAPAWDPDDNRYEGVAGGETDAQEIQARIKRITDRLGPLPGLKFREKLDAFADAYSREYGECAAAVRNAQDGSVAGILVLWDDWLWYEFNVVASSGGWQNSGRGVWKGRHRDTWRTAEGLPYPDPREANALILAAKWHQGCTDISPLVSRDWFYCLAVRMGKFNGQPRASCPFRPEGYSGPGGEVRQAYERLVWGEHPQFKCEGQPVEGGCRGNPYLAFGQCPGEFEVCSQDGSRCEVAAW